METLQFFLESYGLGKVLNPRIFGKRKRRLGEYIFCSVVFSDSEKSYYYLSNSDTILEGDHVQVPVGNDGQTIGARVVDINYYTAEAVPFPIDQIKYIVKD